jgi:hypothetical protein
MDEIPGQLLDGLSPDDGKKVAAWWAGIDDAARSHVAVMFAAMLAGWCVDDDLYLIPGHGRQFLQVSHHEVVHAQFRDEARLLEFVAYMDGKDYALPTEVPDETFTRPSWMRGGTN